MTPAEILESYAKQYKEDYDTKVLNIVTSVMDEPRDKCDGPNRVTGVKTVMRYYTMKPKGYYIDRQYEEHNKATYQKSVITLPPRRFYKEADVYDYMKYVKKVAGRTVTDDEMNLLLKTISRGRQYQLTCMIDRTEELKDVTKWIR